MADDAEIQFTPGAWSELSKEVVETECVPRMERVRDACNAGVDVDGYMVSVEGDDPLQKHSWRATCITATAVAIIDNARYNTLVKNFHKAGGG